MRLRYCRAERMQACNVWKVAFEPGTQNGVGSADPISVPALSALTDRAFEQSTCRGPFEASTSHGWTLDEVFTSLVRIPKQSTCRGHTFATDAYWGGIFPRTKVVPRIFWYYALSSPRRLLRVFSCRALGEVFSSLVRTASGHLTRFYRV